VKTYTTNIHNKQQEPTDINVSQLRILTNVFKIFLDAEGPNTYCFKYCNRIAIKTVCIVHFIATLQKAYSF